MSFTLAFLAFAFIPKTREISGKKRLFEYEVPVDGYIYEEANLWCFKNAGDHGFPRWDSIIRGMEPNQDHYFFNDLRLATEFKRLFGWKQ